MNFMCYVVIFRVIKTCRSVLQHHNPKGYKLNVLSSLKRYRDLIYFFLYVFQCLDCGFFTLAFLL